MVLLNYTLLTQNYREAYKICYGMPFDKESPREGNVCNKDYFSSCKIKEGKQKNYF